MVALLGLSIGAGALLATQVEDDPTIQGTTSLAASGGRLTTTTAAPTTDPTAPPTEPEPGNATTTTTTSSTTNTAPPPRRPTEGIAAVGAHPDGAWFETWRDVPGARCSERRLWRVPRRSAGSIVAVAAAGDRLVELDPVSGAVLAELATWDPAQHQPAGDGVVAVGRGVAPAVSPDGLLLAYGDDRDPHHDGSWYSCNLDVVVRDLASGEERVYPASRDDEGDRPDGSDHLYGVRLIRWSPDGRTLAVNRSYEGDWIAMLDLAAHARLAQAPSLEDEPFAVDSADWLAYGRLVITTWCCYGEEDHRGRVRLADGAGGWRPLSADDEGAHDVAVDPTRAHVAYVRTHPEEATLPELVVRRDLGDPVVLATGYAALDW